MTQKNRTSFMNDPLCRHRCVALIGTFKSFMDEVSMKVCNGSMAYGHQHITNFESQELGTRKFKSKIV